MEQLPVAPGDPKEVSVTEPAKEVRSLPWTTIPSCLTLSLPKLWPGTHYKACMWPNCLSRSVARTDPVKRIPKYSELMLQSCTDHRTDTLGPKFLKQLCFTTNIPARV